MRKISEQSDHAIVCGAGKTGIFVIEEFEKINEPYVAIDTDPEAIESLLSRFPDALTVEGDATADDVLKEAGIERARGVVTCLRDDRDNAFVVLTAKNMRQDLYAVARANEDVAEKVRRAGADMVVSPNYIGGLRLASLFVRPSAVTFLDRMMRDPEFTWRIEDLHISECSQIRDVSIRDSGISNYDILVLAIRRAGKRSFIFKPNAGEVIHKGDTLVVMAELANLRRLRGICNPEHSTE